MPRRPASTAHGSSPSIQSPTFAFVYPTGCAKRASSKNSAGLVRSRGPQQLDQGDRRDPEPEGAQHRPRPSGRGAATARTRQGSARTAASGCRRPTRAPAGPPTAWRAGRTPRSRRAGGSPPAQRARVAAAAAPPGRPREPPARSRVAGIHVVPQNPPCRPRTRARRRSRRARARARGCAARPRPRALGLPPAWLVPMSVTLDSGSSLGLPVLHHPRGPASAQAGGARACGPQPSGALYRGVRRATPSTTSRTRLALPRSSSPATRSPRRSSAWRPPFRSGCGCSASSCREPSRATSPSTTGTAGSAPPLRFRGPSCPRSTRTASGARTDIRTSTRSRSSSASAMSTWGA